MHILFDLFAIVAYIGFCLFSPFIFAQVCFFSATLHSPHITELAKQICTNPTWVDLKGHDSVPDTVHHVLYRVDPERDLHYCVSSPHPACTDNMHSLAGKKRSSSAVLRTPEERSQAVKEIKQHVLLKLIDAYEVCVCMFLSTEGRVESSDGL